MYKFQSTELDGLRNARKAYPKLSQRALAAFIFANYNTYNVGSGRTTSSIYAAIRRVEKAAKAIVTKGVTAAKSKGELAYA